MLQLCSPEAMQAAAAGLALVESPDLIQLSQCVATGHVAV